MQRETDDYTDDMEFGKWLRDQRVNAGLSLEEASEQAEISPQRLKSLEMGLSDKGITHKESERLSKTYRVVLKEILEKAAGVM